MVAKLIGIWRDKGNGGKFTRLREDEIAELLERKVVANLKTMLVVFTVSRVNYEGHSSATV